MPGAELAVHVNRREPGAIEVEAPGDGVEMRDSFDLRVENHGDPAHVHCRLRGDLATIATADRTNCYVGPNDETVVSIVVEDGVDAGTTNVAGAIEVSTRFGAHSVSIPVTVPEEPRPVDVDERLSKPGRRDRGRGWNRDRNRDRDRDRDEQSPFPVDVLDSIRPRPATLGVVALAAVALAVAGAAAVVVGGPVAAVGGVVVIWGIAVAVVLLVR